MSNSPMVDKYMDNIRTFVMLADFAKRIASHETVSWKTKYEQIFSDRISHALYLTGVSFEWTDPDMDYEDDVRAFVNAVATKADELRELYGDEIDRKE